MAKEVVVSPDLAAEIGASVESAGKEADAARTAKQPTPAKTDLQPGAVQPGEELGGKSPSAGKADEATNDGGEASPDAVTDTHVERAVKAGMAIADAKSFRDAKALERVCAALEKKVEGAPAAKVDDPPPVKTEEADLFAAIPDLDPELYDEKVVAGFKAMKDLIRGQHAVISELTKAGGKAKAETWFEGQISALGDAVAAGGPEAAELQDKFDILTAGYKAAGKTVEPEAIFKEAVRVVLGDVDAKASSDAKAASLGKRAGQHLSRPSGNRNVAGGDVLSDVAELVDKKFFKK